jgi:uncharacterized protein (TIGR02266 family)
MGAKEKRGHVRFPLVLAVEYPGSPGAVRDYTENLSANGLFVRTERAFSEGERVMLVLSFPGLLAPQEIEVQVVRRREEGPSQPAGVAVVIPPDAEGARQRLREIAGAAEAAGTPEEPYRLLLVEDNSLVAAMYTSALKRLSTKEGLGGLFVELAGDGNEALARLRDAPRIDIVVTDIYMPVMSGFALLEKMRADPALSSTPVVVITSGNSEERARAARLGAQFFLQKPVKYQDIVATIRTLLATRPRQAASPSI